MRAIKRSIATARDEREAREREGREREAREREAREREAREREAREREARERDLRERLARAARERELREDNRPRTDHVTVDLDLEDVHLIGETEDVHLIDEREDVHLIGEREDVHLVDESATCEHVTRELTTRIDTRGSARPSSRGATTEQPVKTSGARVPPRREPQRPRADIAPLRCEPCPRVVPSRRLFDGSVLQQFQCDGTCVRDEHRAKEKARVHTAQHAFVAQQARVASRYELRLQIAITTVLAVLAAMWIVLAAREASADTTRGERRAAGGRRDATTRHEDATATRGTASGRRGATTRHEDAIATHSTSGDSTHPSDGRRVAGREDRRVAEHETDHDADDDIDDAIDVAAPSTLDAPFAAAFVAPPIAEVLEAAYRTAGLDRDLGRGFVRRARLAGLVPLLTVRTGRDTNWRDVDSNISRGVTLEVRATWRLDRLVFDGRELQVAALDGARRRERRRLAARVIQVYFEWKRAARSAGIQPRAAAVAEEAAAQLDDLTNGWFTEAREPGRP